MNIRDTVRILLLNKKKELLLICIEDPNIISVDGKKHNRFWFTVGGKIDQNETILEAAKRELFEETGIKKENAVFGPIVWYGEVELQTRDKFILFKEKFMIVNTDQININPSNLSENEKSLIKAFEWFSLEKIINHEDVIFPIALKDYLPDILQGNYPINPIKIDNKNCY